MKILIILFVFGAGFSIFTPLGHAQWSSNPAINTLLSDTTQSTPSTTPKAASDGNGGAIIVWARTRIFGQRVNGVKQWVPGGNVVGNLGEPGILANHVNPVVVSDDSGGVIIVWEHFSRGVIAASRVRPDGSVLWERLVCFTTGLRSKPAVASDRAGGAIITWEDYRNGSANADIYAQRVSASGTMMWDSNGVAACVAVRNQTVPQIAPDGQGGAFITWSDLRFTSSRIYAQRINFQGIPMWQPDGMVICAPSSDPAANPKIAATESGEAIIAFARGAGGTWDVYAQKVSLDTVQWVANGVVVCDAIRTQWKVEIVPDGTGGAIISWQDTRRISFDESDVYAQKISSNGVVQWAQNGIPICTQPGNSSVLHTITSDGDGGAIIAWEDRRNGSTDIYAQRVRRAGTTYWTLNGVAISIAPFTQASITGTPDGQGGAIFAWHDSRRTFLDIYGQRVDSEGSLGVTTGVREEVLPESFSLFQNYPNPFNPTTNIKFALPVHSQVRVELYSILGQRVATLVNEALAAGYHTASWNGLGDQGRILGSGVYFYRILAVPTSGGAAFTDVKKMMFVK